MKYKTAFRLALKALGVYLFASSAPVVVRWAVFGYLVALGRSTVDNWLYLGLLDDSLRVVIGLYLFFAGRWVTDMAIPSNRPYCPECAYELTGLGQPKVCPECGTQLPG
jgi:hypothetical protein